MKKFITSTLVTAVALLVFDFIDKKIMEVEKKKAEREEDERLKKKLGTLEIVPRGGK